jgi:hypothetical protein
VSGDDAASFAEAPIAWAPPSRLSGARPQPPET